MPAGTVRPSGSGAARSATSGAPSSTPPAVPGCPPRCTRRRPGPSQPARPIATISAEPARDRPTGVASWTGSSAAGWYPVLSSCWPVSPASASPRCCSTSPSSGPPVRAPLAGGHREESPSQVRLRAERIGALHDQLYLAAETDLEALLGHLDAVQPGLLVVDSIQTITAPGIDGVPGGVTQVRAVTAALVAPPRSATSRSYSSVTSPRTVRLPDPGSSSTWSTWCSSSRATGTPHCGWFAG